MTVMEALYGREQDVCVLVQQQGAELTVMVNRTGPKLRIDKYFHLTAHSALIKAFDSLSIVTVPAEATSTSLQAVHPL